MSEFSRRFEMTTGKNGSTFLDLNIWQNPLTFEIKINFKDYLKEWKRRLPADKSWVNLKTEFRQAHIEVREYDDDTIAAIQHAHIAQQVIDGIAHLIPPPAETPLPPRFTSFPFSKVAHVQNTRRTLLTVSSNRIQAKVAPGP